MNTNATSVSKTGLDNIISARPISEIWAALGGGPLRFGRGRAFWRDGKGFNVDLDDSKGVWHDHARSEGGGVLALVQTVQGCSRQDALRWLADYAGLPLAEATPAQRQQWRWDRAQRQYALCWARAARLMAEQALERLSPDPECEELTRLLCIVNAGGTALLSEYRAWLDQDRELTEAMVRAGQASEARLHRGLALLIREWGRNVA